MASKRALAKPARTGVRGDRRVRGIAREGASFPVAPARAEAPHGYLETLADIKQRIQAERLRVVLAASSAMVLLYWDIGRVILDRQEREGWGARVIDRLSADLRDAYPEMRGLSPRNLKYMRSFAAAWPDRSTIVQEPLARLPWSHQIALLERLSTAEERLWYAARVLVEGWSHAILVLQIERRARERHGKALTNFEATLPPADSDFAAQVFKDPYVWAWLQDCHRLSTFLGGWHGERRDIVQQGDFGDIRRGEERPRMIEALA
ncbi:MAG TPA: DUF1016 N-terminal domain-containing protein, partial [Minicystis sp.]|nr:DUF1016 N-terminal domain-containing protein [Minicystis sp.]